MGLVQEDVLLESIHWTNAPCSVVTTDKVAGKCAHHGHGAWSCQCGSSMNLPGTVQLRVTPMCDGRG